MPDWSQSMEQTFEYYTVDPNTWGDVEKLDTITSASISYDSSSDTLGSASFEATDVYGESYIRTYLVTVQNGVRERFCLGTHLIQTPSSSSNGMYTSAKIDAYTPLIELTENSPDLGYYIPEGEAIMNLVCTLTRQHLRAPVVDATDNIRMYKNYVANTDDTWLSFLSSAMANANFTYELDEYGRILFEPQQDARSMQPVYTFTDDNSSILYSDVDIEHDMYGMPNVVEVVYSDNNKYFTARVVNDDPNSPVSTVNRGRNLVAKVSNPDIMGAIPTQKLIDEYAEEYLRSASTLTYTIEYAHGYVPQVRVGRCVMLNFTRLNLTNIKAVVKSQSIDCTPSTKVDETASFEMKLWG